MFSGWFEPVDEHVGAAGLDSNHATTMTVAAAGGSAPKKNGVGGMVDWTIVAASANDATTTSGSMTRKAKGPPCKVCGDEASGFHYGVDSCEGCKGFFRRCITQGMSHQCASSRSCEITPYSRNSCQFCRLKKCLDVGMSREASRLGRRPKRLQEARRQRDSIGSSAAASILDREYQLNQVAATAVMGIQQLYRHRPNEMISSPSGMFNCGASGMRATGGQTALNMLDFQKLMQSISEGVNNRLTPSSLSYFAGGSGLKTPLSPNETVPRSPHSEMSPISLSSLSNAGDYSTSTARDYHRPSPFNLVRDSTGLSRDTAPTSTASSSPVIGTSYVLHSSPATSTGAGSGYLSPTDYKCEEPLLNLHAMTSRATPSGGRMGVASVSSRAPLSMERRRVGGATGGHTPSDDDDIEADRTRKRDIDGERCVCKACGCDGAATRRSRISVVADKITSGSLSSITAVDSPSSNEGPMTSSTSRYFGSCSRSSSPCREDDQSTAEDGDVFRTYSSTDYVSRVDLPQFTPIQQSDSSFAAFLTTDAVITSSSSRAASPLRMPEHTARVSERLADLARDARKPYSERRKQIIDRATENIIDAHMQTCNYTFDKLAVSVAGYENMMRGKPEGWDLQQMKSISGSSQSSGWFDLFIQNMEPVIKRVVNFCKLLEGFREFSMEDEVALVKQGMFAVIIVRYSRLFTDKGMFVPTMNARIPRDKIPTMTMGDFFEKQFQFADQFNLLKLDDAEIALLTSVIILNPDREGVVDKKGVNDYLGLCLQCLYNHMKATRPDSYEAHFNRVLSILPLIECINAIHLESVATTRDTMPTLPFPAIHVEIFEKP